MDLSSPYSEALSMPHAVLLSLPAQGHLKPILTLAKLLHSRCGFRVTLVNTEFTHRRLLRSSPGAAAAANDSINGFRFAVIPNGLTPSPIDPDTPQDISALFTSMREHCPAFFLRLLSTLSPPPTCVIVDGSMCFCTVAAVELGIPAWTFFTNSGCGFWSYMNMAELVERGYTPFKDESFLTNGYLDTKIDFIPGMKGIRLRDLPSFIRTTNANDLLLQSILKRANDTSKGVGVILNTFEALELDVLAEARKKFSNLYTIGPLGLVQPLLVAAGSEAAMIGANLWKNDSECLSWLDGQEQGKVVYVNFGSVTVLSAYQLEEFAWGLTAAGYPALWIIRPDLVPTGAAAAQLPEGFLRETNGRTKVAAWCDQEAVLAHPAIGVFLTHCGWNSTLESLWEGVPMMCWPYFAEQATNCNYVCRVWGVGLEIEGEVRRERVEELVREVMEGDKAAEMKRRAREWKQSARTAIEPRGSSYVNLEKLMSDLTEAKKYSIEEAISLS